MSAEEAAYAEVPTAADVDTAWESLEEEARRLLWRIILCGPDDVRVSDVARLLEIHAILEAAGGER